ncbi:thioredoxin-disulfide reductase [Candidatus Babeliales bacterium]|nr:thioredoxin-disulfide reductase [Candidatus Babeliales bacterium]
MSAPQIFNTLIIGSGPAGLTAAIYASRAFLKPIVIEGKNPGGQLMGTTAVENWPGEKSIFGPQLMMNMKEHAQHFGTQFLSREIVRVDFSKHPFSVFTHKDEELLTHSVIIATGASPNRLGCSGEDDYWGKGVTTCAVCDGAFYPGKKVVIVGGGDTAMEDASFMTKYTNDITIVHILDKFTASPAMQERILSNPTIKIIYSSTVTAIKGNGSHVTNIEISNQVTGQTYSIDTDVVFLAIGQKPNTGIFKGQLELDKMGYISLNNTTHTSVEGVFVAGDVADYRYKQAITSAGSGCMAALDTQRYLEKIIK